MDRVMFGIITACRTCHLLRLYPGSGNAFIAGESPTTLPEPSDYVNTLLRDPTSSHLLETVIRSAPDDAFTVLWSTYFSSRLARLAHHPVANFVVAKALERASPEQLGETLQELNGVWHKSISTSSCEEDSCVLIASQKIVGLASCARQPIGRPLYILMRRKLSR